MINDSKNVHYPLSTNRYIQYMYILKMENSKAAPACRAFGIYAQYEEQISNFHKILLPLA